MGSPRAKSPNPFSQAAAGFTRGLQDVGTGLDQLSKGNLEEGLWNTLAGQSNVMSGGAGSLLGIEGGAAKARVMAENAEAQATADAQSLAEAEIKGKRDAIAKRLEAEIQLRTRMPGRSQTLLTNKIGNTLPGANNTLLSIGKK